jgi:hypothetical protein
VAGRYVPSAHTFPGCIAYKLKVGAQRRHTVRLGTLNAHALAGVRILVPHAAVPREAPGIAVIAEQGVQAGDGPQLDKDVRRKEQRERWRRWGSPPASGTPG